MEKVLSTLAVFIGVIAILIVVGKSLGYTIQQVESLIGVQFQWGWMTAAVGAALSVLYVSACAGSVRHSSKPPTFDYWSADNDAEGTEWDGWNLSIKRTRATSETEARILTLSGGGYKAGLFHLGSIKALNEIGKLRSIDAISSVSGGSITTAWLGSNWDDLDFNADGVATNFDEVIHDPLFEFYTSETIDVPAIMLGILPFQRTSNRLANAFDRRLFEGRRLSSSPNPG